MEHIPLTLYSNLVAQILIFMKLSPKALKAINNPSTRRRLMDVLGCTEFTIARYIQKNSDNLTKAAALQVIREVTGLGDAEILVQASTEQ
jgi:hypothetical protein